MIYSLYASDKRFKTIKFKKGLNIIIADRTDTADRKDSRNGLGKTLLINIIHFCLGSGSYKQLLPIEIIKEWTFYLELDIGDQRVTIARSIHDNSIIKLKGDYKDLPILPEENNLEGYKYYSISEWNRLLGISMFGLEVKQEQYTPSVRVLLSYFIRKGIEGYISPFIYFRNQPSWSVQVHNAFLLGIDWHHIAKFQDIKAENNIISMADRAMRTGIIISQGELESEKVRLQHEIERDRIELSQFKVHDQYKVLQEEVNQCTRRHRQVKREVN